MGHNPGLGEEQSQLVVGCPARLPAWGWALQRTRGWAHRHPVLSALGSLNLERRPFLLVASPVQARWVDSTCAETGMNKITF